MSGLRRLARVDHDALRRNLAKLTDSPAAEVADLRADAYGHGLLQIARTLDAAGLGGAVVSLDADRSRLADAGIRMSLHTESPLAGEPGQHMLGPALFGLLSEPAPAEASATEPVLRLSGEVVAVKPVPAGRGVSYGYTYRTANPSRLALIGLGYADGVPRPASNRAPVLIGSFTGTVSGRIAMDQFVVDLGDEHASVGDEAVLFGSPLRGEPSVLDWAQATRIPAESITAGLGQRIERIHLP
ncbi:alanine racemase C-terminal domain-containing protein [Diaminobutyricimonas sp. LJ205]|uniref:alanine racemase C-terminal domain-containing protein n=1 Tax=Diaminobutyricimonas sp. LJ205 TaxID=2683590 RepID=UPI00351A62E7